MLYARRRPEPGPRLRLELKLKLRRSVNCPAASILFISLGSLWRRRQPTERRIERDDQQRLAHEQDAE